MFSRDVARDVWDILGDQFEGRIISWNIDDIYEMDITISQNLMFNSLSEIDELTDIFPIDLSEHDNSAIIQAAFRGLGLDVIKRICSSPNVNPNADRCLALRTAVDNNMADVVEFLMNHGADPYETDTTFGILSQEEYFLPSAMQMAAMAKRDDLMIIMMKGSKPRWETVLEFCCQNGCYEAFRWIMDHPDSSHVPAWRILDKILETMMNVDFSKILIKARKKELTQWHKKNKLTLYNCPSAYELLPLLVRETGLQIGPEEIREMIKYGTDDQLFQLLRDGQNIPQLCSSITNLPFKVKELDDYTLMIACKAMRFAQNHM